MYVLGISCYYHDSAASLLRDGLLIAAADEERFSRIKHDSSFPKKAINFCLKKANISVSDLNYVVFYEKPFVKFERLFLSSLAFSPKSFSFFRESMKKWFLDQLWIKDRIISNLGIPKWKLIFSQHHLSHVSSAYFSSPYRKSAVLSIDAVGEWTTVSWGIAENNKISLKEELIFPHSLGLLYSAFTVFTGFEANEGEYKMMGLAPYGKPKYVEEIKKIIDIKEDGSFATDLSFFSYQYSLKNIYTKKFEELFGKINKNSSEVIAYYADIAASMQYVLEEILVKIVNYVHKKTNMDYLCYAGGVALNSSANWKILNNSKFKQIFIQPAAGDSGGSLGAALWASNTVFSCKKRFEMEHTYWGEEESEEQIETFFNKENISYKTVNNDSLLVEEIAEKMEKGKVVGWVQGRFEWGPRALGNRSILGDPRTSKMRSLVNRKIKFREAFRPFAPSVISEKASSYFDLPEKTHPPLKYMLYVVPVKENMRKKLGAVTHVDGTARPQLVEKNINPLYYNLISCFGKKTGIPVVLNTSFNLKGEPIVNTCGEAFSTFERSGLDTLVVGNKVIEK
ncbi:MAG: carbamoyltransferase N-terminal domain-containing protein [Candidatus Levybacteria bacterium]|nr:carbamoyltransferase N-terminal domain-containing protein [Candidatus Levybacteria bacterium]